MGKILAVWSDQKKTGKSVVTYMLANQIKKMASKDLKLLVCCLNFKYSSLYKLFGIDEMSTGMEELINYTLFEGESPQILEQMIPGKGSIYFTGSYRMTSTFVKKNIEKYEKLLEELQKSFDLIIFDTVSGKENILTNLVLQKADVVLKLFNQDNESLGLIKEKGPGYNQETIYLVSKYRNIYPRISDIQRRYSLKKVYTVEYCETLQEMKNRNSMHLYLQHETQCNNSVKRLSRHVLDALDLMPDEVVKEKTRNYIKIFSKYFVKPEMSGGRELR